MRLTVFSVCIALLTVGAKFCDAQIAQVPRSNHVYVLLEENHSFEDIDYGHMPYLNGLAAHNTLLVNSYANSHYSIPNYFWLTTGQYVTQDDNTLLTFDVDNIVDHLLTGGMTWKAYEEGLPYAGYIGYNLPDGCQPGNCIYVKRHDPFPYFNDVINSGVSVMNIVPFEQLATDIANDTLPNYGFITPNLGDDAHDGTLLMADQWLQTNIAALLATPPFQPGGDGVLIITSDESQFTDCRPLLTCPPLPENQSGGRIYTVIIGPQVQHGYRSVTNVRHDAILRLVEQLLGIDNTGYLGSAATAPELTDVFTGTNPAPPVYVTLNSPLNNTIVSTTPLQISASATSTKPITGWRVYANGVNIAGGSQNPLFSAQVSLQPGTYKLIVRAWDSTGAHGDQTINITVQAATTPPPSVVITSPASGATVASPVIVSASFNNGGVPQYMKVWVDGVGQYVAKSVTSITTSPITLSSGVKHKITVQAYTGTMYSSVEYVTVQ